MLDLIQPENQRFNSVQSSQPALLHQQWIPFQYVDRDPTLAIRPSMCCSRLSPRDLSTWCCGSLSSIHRSEQHFLSLSMFVTQHSKPL